jgi:hypothetical protein
MMRELGENSGNAPAPQLSEELRKDIASLKEMMLTVHYFAETSWLVAAVEFPGLCKSPLAQESLRNAARIAWQFGFPEVTRWLNEEVLEGASPAPAAVPEKRSVLQRPDVEPA